MTTVVVAARLLLALALGTAAVLKLGSTRATETSARELGLPAPIARVVSFALAPTELLIAFSLVPGVTAYGATIAAFLLLAAFTYLIATNVRRGNTPACACFGAASDEPISSRTLVRNVALLSLAALSLAAGPGLNKGAIAATAQHVSEAGTDSALAVLGLVLALQVAATAVVLGRRLPPQRDSQTTHQHHEPQPLAPQGWPPGSLAPRFSVETVDGLRTSLIDLLRRERPVFLLFTDPSCAPCSALLPEVADWQGTYGDLLSIVVISSGLLEANREKRDSLGLRDVLVQGGTEVADAYRYLGTPGAVLVGRDGRIASRVATGAGAIRSLFYAAVNDLDPPQTVGSAKPQRLPAQVPPGEFAPPVSLRTLDGGTVSMNEFLGRMHVALFWSPTCGFCQQMREDVLRWERNADDVQLVVLSSGGAQANALQRFASPMLLDDDGATMRAFGAVGTPSAVLVDAEGRVASSVAVGAEEVMGLLDRANSLARAASALSGEDARPAR